MWRVRWDGPLGLHRPHARSDRDKSERFMFVHIQIAKVGSQKDHGKSAFPGSVLMGPPPVGL